MSEPQHQRAAPPRLPSQATMGLSCAFAFCAMGFHAFRDGLCWGWYYGAGGCGLRCSSTVSIASEAVIAEIRRKRLQRHKHTPSSMYDTQRTAHLSPSRLVSDRPPLPPLLSVATPRGPGPG